MTTDDRPLCLPLNLSSDADVFELSTITEVGFSGSYFRPNSPASRFEVRVEYISSKVEWFSIFADLPYSGTTNKHSHAMKSFHVTLDIPIQTVDFIFPNAPSMNFSVSMSAGTVSHVQSIPDLNDMSVIFDVSDLVYYIGHHDNLTGIQRVQASILLGLKSIAPNTTRQYVSYDNISGDFALIDTLYFESLLIDLSLPNSRRTVVYDRSDAVVGVLPNSTPLSDVLASHRDERLIIYLLGAAWVNSDYFHRILDLKRNHGASFCLTIHDLIPIYARETCDQGTAIVFEEFLRKSFLFADHYFAVSEYTALDLHRFAKSMGLRNAPISVVQNAHAFDEFRNNTSNKTRRMIRGDYVLFISTIEGRKNHDYIFDVWSALVSTGRDIPQLICVGRLGWRAERFLEKMLLTSGLHDKIRILSDVSDVQLDALYENCLFTVYPSIYEGWGLPVGESLSKGKICVTSNRSSLPEVGGKFCVYVDVDSIQDGVDKVGRLIFDTTYRRSLELILRDEFVPRSWTDVAGVLAAQLSLLPSQGIDRFPTVIFGREYKIARLPARYLDALGGDMLTEVQLGRRAIITGYLNRDEDLLIGQSMRAGPTWCAPENWGTWSRFPDARRLFYLSTGTTKPINIVIYDCLRVCSPLIGHKISVAVNRGTPTEYLIDRERFLLRSAGTVRPDDDNMAEVEISYHISPTSDVTEKLKAIDGRILGLGFESSIIAEDSDITTRLSVVEWLLFGTTVGVSSSRRHDETWSRRPGLEIHALPTRQHAVVATNSAPVPTPSLTRPPGGWPTLPINEEVNIGEGETTSLGSPTSNFLNEGWFPVERSGAWSSSTRAQICLKAPLEAGSYFLIRATLRSLADNENSNIVTILLDGVKSDAAEINTGEFFSLNVVVTDGKVRGNNIYHLTICCEHLTKPRSRGISSDSRDLGLLIHSLSLLPLPILSAGRRYVVDKGATWGHVFISGWYPMEELGLWSRSDGGRFVAVLMASNVSLKMYVELRVLARVYGTLKTGPVTVSVFAQGVEVALWHFDNDFLESQSALLPVLRVDGGYLVEATFYKHDAVSPSECGDSDDNRRLGILVTEFTITNALQPLLSPPDGAALISGGAHNSSFIQSEVASTENEK